MKPGDPADTAGGQVVAEEGGQHADATFVVHRQDVVQVDLAVLGGKERT